MAAIAIIIIAVIGVGIYGYNAYVGSSESGTITIYAAASLAKQMNATAAEFKKTTPQRRRADTVRWKFGSYQSDNPA
nr:hypothetical protein [Methanobacterium formicicum]